MVNFYIIYIRYLLSYYLISLLKNKENIMKDHFSEFINVKYKISQGASRDTLFISSKMNFPKLALILPLIVTALPFILGGSLGAFTFLGMLMVIIIGYYFVYRKAISPGYYNGVIHVNRKNRVIEKSHGLKIMDWNIIELDQQYILVQDRYTQIKKYKSTTAPISSDSSYNTFFRLYLISVSSIIEENNKEKTMDNLLENLDVFTNNIKMKKWLSYEIPDLPKDAILLCDNKSYEIIKIVARFISSSLELTIFDMIPDATEYIKPEDVNKNLIERLDSLGYSKENIINGYKYLKKPKNKTIQEFKNGLLIKIVSGNLKFVKILSCSILGVFIMAGIIVSSFNPIGLIFTFFPAVLLFMVIMLNKAIMVTKDGVRGIFTIFDYQVSSSQFIPIDRLESVQDIDKTIYFLGCNDNISSYIDEKKASEFAEKAVKKWFIENMEEIKNNLNNRKSSNNLNDKTSSKNSKEESGNNGYIFTLEDNKESDEETKST